SASVTFRAQASAVAARPTRLGRQRSRLRYLLPPKSVKPGRGSAAWGPAGAADGRSVLGLGTWRVAAWLGVPGARAAATAAFSTVFFPERLFPESGCAVSEAIGGLVAAGGKGVVVGGARSGASWVASGVRSGSTSRVVGGSALGGGSTDPLSAGAASAAPPTNG